MTTSVSLRNLIDSARRLDELDAARVIANVAEVVHKQQKGGHPLHTITPEGIVVSAEGDATLQSTASTLSAYTSPERLRGEAGDRRSDVFALGAILWEALVHEQHFEGEIDGEIRASVLEGEYRSATELNANVPAELDAICKKALARSPADRYPSCKVMAAEISTVLDDAGYPDDNTAIVEHLATKYVAPAPKPAKVSSSRETPMPGTPIIAAPAPIDLARSSPTQTLQGVAPRKELEEALAKQAAAAAGAADSNGAASGAASNGANGAAAPTKSDAARAKSPSSQPLGASTAGASTAGASPAAASTADAARAKSPSSQPLGALTSTAGAASTAAASTADAARAKSPSSQPFGAATSPTSIANAARAKSPSSQPVGASILDAVPPRTESRSQHPGAQTLTGTPPLVVAPAAPAPPIANAATTTLPDAPTLLNTPAPLDAPAHVATAASAPKSFSKTAILGSLSSADLALPPVEDDAAAKASATPSVPIGRKTEVQGSASGSLADKLAAINQGTDAAQPGGVLMLGLPAVPPGADPSSFKTPLPGTLPPPATLAPPANITTAETVATPALAQPLPPVLPDSKTTPPAQALQMAAAATGVAVSPTDSMPPGDTSPGVHPASVVALPRPRSASEAGAQKDPTHSGEKRDPLAGWGWGTGPHDTVSPEDDDFYETQTSNKKRLVYAIGGAAVAVLLIVVTAFAFGGKKDAKKPDVAAKQTEPAVDWSQPTDPPPAPPVADPNAGSGSAVDPNTGSAIDPNAAGSGSALDPSGGVAGDPNAGSAGSAALVDPNAGPNAGPSAVASAANAGSNAVANTGSNLAATSSTPTATASNPPATVDTAPVKPEPVVKPEPKKPEPVAKVEPKKIEPKKVEPKKPEPKKVEPKVVAKAEPKKVEPKQKKLPPPQPVAKTAPKSSWDPLATSVKPVDAKKPAGPIDPYANEAPTPKKTAVDANAAYKTGIQQFARGDSNGALTTFKGSLAANPDFAPTWRGIGMVYEKLGRRAQAKTAFKRYLQLSPSAGDAESIRERMERL